MSNWSDHAILVVDDCPLQRGHAVAILHGLGFRSIFQATDGLDALLVLEQPENALIDIVLSDLDMPGMDGIELMRAVTEKNLARNMIMMTARDPRLLDAVESMAIEEKSIRLLGVLHKPLDADVMVSMLSRATRESRSERHDQDARTFSVARIASALQHDEFLPFYQPKVEIATGLLKGVEALARWQHPELGLLSPQSFIPVLEAEGAYLMEPFTRSLLKTVLLDLAGWLSHGQSLSVSVNFSAQALSDATLADQLVRMAEAAHIPPDCLVLELTESAVMKNLFTSIGNLTRLRLKGFGVSMDDFGVGYSSIQQLSRCPFTEIKIDRVFVHGAADHFNRRSVLEGLIDLGRRMKVTTVGEGVETEEEWRMLRDLGCELGQGYFAGRPMPAAELAGWTRAHRHRLTSLFD